VDVDVWSKDVSYMMSWDETVLVK